MLQNMLRPLTLRPHLRRFNQQFQASVIGFASYVCLVSVWFSTWLLLFLVRCVIGLCGVHAKFIWVSFRCPCLSLIYVMLISELRLHLHDSRVVILLVICLLSV